MASSRIGGRERGAEVRVRIGVVRRETHRLAKRGDAARIVSRLNQHQAEVVLRFGVVGTETNRFTKRRRDVRARGAGTAEQPAERVVRLRPAGVGRLRGRRQRRAKRRDRSAPVRLGRRRRLHVQPCFELPDSRIELARAQIRDAEIHIDSGARRQQRDRALQADARAGQVSALAQHRAEKRVTLTGRGIELHALLQLRDGAVFLAAVPERHAEMVVRLRGRPGRMAIARWR